MAVTHSLTVTSLKLGGENQRNRFPEQKEIAALLLAAPAHLKPIIRAAINLGTRAGKETLGLKWTDIDLEKRLVHVTRSKQKNGAVKIDAIPMKDIFLFKGLRPHFAKPNDHVLLYKGRPVKRVGRDFNKACKRAGVKDFRFHDLRQTCASHLIMAGASAKEVQENLGNENISTTSRYMHLSVEAKRKTVNPLNGLTPKIAANERQG